MFYKKSNNENGFEFAVEAIDSPIYKIKKNNDCQVFKNGNQKDGWEWFDTEEEMRISFNIKEKIENKPE